MSAPDDDLFAEALALPPGERPRFLADHCGGDPTRRANLESMLAAHDRATQRDFMSATLVAPHRPPAETAGDRIGRYVLLEKIGEGGCGVVFRAEQKEPVRREVALKVIKLGMDTATVVARFEAERQALALMDHPGIAKVFDGGATHTGRPYFVMELVRGVRITEFCDRQLLPVEQRLRLFIAVCRAVQHAHQKGVIHRDLKPSNILVSHDAEWARPAGSASAPQTGEPARATASDMGRMPMPLQAYPKIIDFGIAKATQDKLTNATLFTAVDQFIGTPAYMSPEQAEPGAADIDTRSDVYSLGVLLYELLSGRLPFETTATSGSVDEVRRAIREREPPRPSARLRTLASERVAAVAEQRATTSALLLATLRGDLDWIVLRCLEKDPARRYDSAANLALDLERYLAHEPVSAVAPSIGYVARKWIRRHRVAFAAGSAILLLLIGGLTLSTWLFLRERRTLERARAAEQKTVEAFRAALKQQSLAAQERARTGDVRALVADPQSRAAVLEALAEIYAQRGEAAKAETARAEARTLRLAR